MRIDKVYIVCLAVDTERSSGSAKESSKKEPSKKKVIKKKAVNDKLSVSIYEVNFVDDFAIKCNLLFISNLISNFVLFYFRNLV